LAGPSYASVMEPQPEASALLMLARELRDAAVRGGRPDVAAKADEAIVLITGTDDTAAAGEAPSDGDKGNAVIRILDGLGF
jgi:hypothetical protein